MKADLHLRSGTVTLHISAEVPFLQGDGSWLIGTMNPFECPFTLFSSAQSGVLSPNELTALVITCFSLSSLPPFHSNLSAVAFSIRVALEKMEQFSVCI